MTFSEAKHRHGNLVAGFECARIKKSIIYATIPKRKAPITMLFRSKAPKTPQMEVADMCESQWTF